jgi:hypothetical protein
VGPRAGLDRCGKSRPPPGFDSRTVQPVASRYTDCATRPTTQRALEDYSGTCEEKTADDSIRGWRGIYKNLLTGKLGAGSETYNKYFINHK